MRYFWCLIPVLLIACKSNQGTIDLQPDELNMVDVRSDIAQKDWPEGTWIQVKTTAAIYKIQSKPLENYPQDGIAVIPVKDKYAILQADNRGFYNVQHFDLSQSNATPNINKAIQFCASLGGGTLFFPSGRYTLREDHTSPQAFGAIRLLPGVSLLGEQAELLLRSGTAFISVRSKGIYSNAQATSIVQNVKYGDRRLSVASTTHFEAGDEVLLRIGDNEWDARETRYGVLAKIKEVTANNELILEQDILTEVNINKVTNPKNLLVRKIDAVIRDISISGFTLINDMKEGANAHSGVDVRGVENVQISDITAINPGAGALVVAYSSNVQATRIKVTKSLAQNKQRSKGRGVSFWNSFNCSVENLEVAYFEGHVMFCESYSKNIVLSTVKIMDNCPTRRKDIPYFFIGQGSESTLRDVTVEGFGNYAFVGNGGTRGEYKVHNLTLDLQKPILGGLLLNRTSGILRIIDTTSNTCQHFDLSSTKSFTVKIAASNIEKLLPEGLIVSYSIQSPAEKVLRDGVEVYIGKQGTHPNKTQLIRPSARKTVRSKSANVGSYYNGSLEFEKKTRVLFKTDQHISSRSDHKVKLEVEIAPLTKHPKGSCGS